MKKIYILFAILPMLMISCGKDDLEVSYQDPADYFMPADDATDSTSILRRNFYDEYGTYLLFNDTLQYRYEGLNSEGEESYFTEVVDLTYYVGQTNSSNTEYYFTYLTSYPQRLQALDFLEQYVLTHTKGKMKPFSWLLVNKISGKNNLGSAVSPYAVAGQRCVAVACNYIIVASRTDAQKKNLAQRVLLALIGKMANNNADAFTEFFKVSSKYYDQSMTSDGSSLESDKEKELLYAAGFVGSSSQWGSYYPSQEDDLNQYATLLIQKTEAQLESLYGSYPLIMSKINLMRSTMISLGYVF